MKTTTIILALAFAALVWAETKPSGTAIPAQPVGNTTTQAPNTTTQAPNTTTHAPNTTTHAPNTTTQAPNTTTHAPNTTTQAPNTTTQAPTPTVPPTNDNSTVGNYTVMNGGKLCLRAQMELKITVKSKDANGTFLLLPNGTSTAGSCNDTEATLSLISQELNISLSYLKDLKENKVFVNFVTFNLTYDFDKKGFGAVKNYSHTNSTLRIFEAQVGKSYSCKKEQVNLGEGYYLDIGQDRMQAFNFTNNNDFGAAEPCPADQNNYHVALAVGITLLVLVVVVCFAYFLARKKRTDGYQSL